MSMPAGFGPGKTQLGGPSAPAETPTAPSAPAGGLDYSKVDFDTALRILSDVNLSVTPEQSRLTYTPDMLAYRAQLEKEVAGLTAQGLQIDHPYEIPPVETSGEIGVARATQEGPQQSAVDDLLRAQPDERSISGLVPDPSKDDPAPDGGSSSAAVSFGPGKTALDSEDDDKPDSTKPVDWYVDIDFPPLESTDPLPFMQAMTALATLLPQNEASQRLIISMSLNTLGVNDVDQITDKIMSEVAKQNAQMQAQGGFNQPMQPRIPPGQQPQQLGPGGKPQQPQQPRPFGMSEARMAKIVEIVEEAAAAMERVSGDDPG